MMMLSSGEIATLLAIAQNRTDETLRVIANQLSQYDYQSVCQFVQSLESRGLVASKREGRFKLLQLSHSGKLEATIHGKRWVLIDNDALPCKGCACKNHLS